jgi:hypothetical protein
LDCHFGRLEVSFPAEESHMDGRSKRIRAGL